MELICKMEARDGLGAIGRNLPQSNKAVLYFSPMTAVSGRTWQALAAPQSGGFSRL